MQKSVHSLMNGAFNVLKGPTLSILMIFVVISLWRLPPGRLE